MRSEQNKLYDEILTQVSKFYNKCEKFVQISDVEFPKVKEVSMKACEEGERVNECMGVTIIRKYKQMYIREIFRALKMNTIKEKRKKLVQTKMMNTFRRQFAFIFFKKWRRKAYELKKIGRKDSLVGAQL